MNSSQTKMAKGAFSVFSVILILINLAVTYQFGSHFLGGAFGIQNTEAASIFGGLYAVLFLDVAYLCWLGLYLRGSETSSQRAVAAVGGLFGFVGSLMATLYMLIQGTAGTLANYSNAVETVAQVGMIVIVAVHIVLALAFVLFSREESVRQTSIDSASDATDKALTMAKTNVKKMIPTLATQISASIEQQIYSDLNFQRGDDGQWTLTEAAQDKPKQIGFAGKPKTKMFYRRPSRPTPAAQEPED